MSPTLLCQVGDMSSAPAKSAGYARYASQDPFIQSMLSHTILTPLLGVHSFSDRSLCPIFPRDFQDSYALIELPPSLFV